MKTTIFTLVLLLFGTITASAQNYRTDGGLLVTEDSPLSATSKRIIFVVAKEIPGPARVELQTSSSEGIVNQFAPLQFPQGLHRGQILPVWNGEFNQFHETPWLNFWVTVYSGSDVYYADTMFPVGYREQYKEPLVASISEEGGYTSPYQITVKGIFDTTIPSLILINTNMFIPPRTIRRTAPGIIQFAVEANNWDQFPSGKYLLTLCQASHCDTLEGRHR